MEKNSKILSILVILLALVLGFVWLNQNSSSEVVENDNIDKSDSIISVYESSDLGYSLVIPDEWNEYNYTVEYKTLEQGGYVLETETFTSDFEDWESFELLTIGSIDKTDHYEAIEAFNVASNQGNTNFELLDSFPTYLAIGSVIGENDEKVFFNYFVRQDAPNRYAEDGGPMPNFETDFEIL